jgi:glutamyl-tRNA reductase
MRLVLVGTSHHLAPVEVRERVALSGRQAGELARRLARDVSEAVCLSTCNRTELYVADADADRAGGVGPRALADRAGLAEGELSPALFRLSDEAAALHLFRVAAGLDSLVPGEAEILGQVRAAAAAGAAGPFLGRLFRQALHAGKKARAETAIGESPASVSSAAAALAEQVFGDLDGCRVLLIGAGKVGELAARSLSSRGASVAYVAGRTEGRAESIARAVRGEAIASDRLAGVLADVDVVVSSTSAPDFVIGREDAEAAARSRRGRPLFLIDLAVPRDADPGIHEVDGCYLYDIDDLEAVVQETLVARRGEAARAEAIAVEEAERFRTWQASLDAVPAIASLRARAEEIRTGELAKAERRLDRLSEAERRVVDSITTAIVNKLLHLPTVRMKEAAAAEGGGYVEVVRHLFGLPDDERPQGRNPRQ